MKRIKFLYPVANTPRKADPRWIDWNILIARTYLFHSLIQVTQYTTAAPPWTASEGSAADGSAGMQVAQNNSLRGRAGW